MDERRQILKIRDLNISFKTDHGKIDAIRGVNLDLYKGETIAIVGESGSGKSVTTKAIMGILAGNGNIESGSILYNWDDEYTGEYKEVDIVNLSKNELQKEIRGRKIAMVFQDPMTSLNPTMTIGAQIMEPMIYHYKKTKKEAYEKSLELLELVGITDAEKRMKNYPHQLSGGMRQRVVIAIALSCDPYVLICDEPTTALDVTIQAKILELIAEIQKKKDLSVIYITHDLGVVAKVADFVNVMYAGKIVEKGSVDEIYYDPRHPYTWGLLSAMPDLDTDSEELYAIPGTPPNLAEGIKGDAFAPRNAFALNIDLRLEPPMFDVEGSETHKVASWLMHEKAPKIEMPESLKKRIELMKEKSVSEATSKAIDVEEQVVAREAQETSNKEVADKENGVPAILEVQDLKQYFKMSKKFTVKAVDGISFKVYPGQTYGLVGESGSGKSTTGRSIIRLYKPSSGEVTFNEESISGKLSKGKQKLLRTKMQMIFQDPMASLNPRKKVIDIIAEGLDIHNEYKNIAERDEKVYKILELVGLSKEHATRYPHQFSGGQRQRIGIARALIMNPDLIIADEAISALDVSIQAQVVNLMKQIQKETNTAILFIAHDLSMVKYISDHIGVLHLGHLVETGTTEEIFANPVHPYTKSLLSAIPIPNPRVEKTRVSLTYDYKAEGVDYSKGRSNHLGGEHYVLATEEELSKWTK